MCSFDYFDLIPIAFKLTTYFDENENIYVNFTLMFQLCLNSPLHKKKNRSQRFVINKIRQTLHK